LLNNWRRSDPVTRDAIANRETTYTKVRKTRKAEGIRTAVSLPDAKYRVVYADPPWKYGNAIDEAMPGTTATESHYPCMTITELCALPIAPIVDRGEARSCVTPL
jgi:16S rRNA G966 N2-methylase RsmD